MGEQNLSFAGVHLCNLRPVPPLSLLPWQGTRAQLSSHDIMGGGASASGAGACTGIQYNKYKLKERQGAKLKFL